MSLNIISKLTLRYLPILKSRLVNATQFKSQMVNYKRCPKQTAQQLASMSSESSLSTDKLRPIMVEKVLDMLQPKNGELILDMTFGAGGHTRKIINQVPEVRIIALDRDPLAYNAAKELSTNLGRRQILPLLGEFSELQSLFTEHAVEPNSLDGVLLDAGASLMQLTDQNRGFSLNVDGPLDMRMNGNRDTHQPTAADVVNHLDVQDLFQIIKKYGEERMAKTIAHAIVEARHVYGNITRSKQLADIVASAFPTNYATDRLNRRSHVATRTFQALRIFVNDELNQLSTALKIAHTYLKPGGRCIVLSFHSLEDRIVKRHFNSIDLDAEGYTIGQYRSGFKIHSLEHVNKVKEKNWLPITKKVVQLDFHESLMQPRARSAKLRGAIKLSYL